VFAYRALRFGRGDATPLSGFEQDDFMRGANFNKRSFEDLAKEYEYVRRASISLFASLEDDAWARRGTANNDEVSVRGLAFIIAAQDTIHINVPRKSFWKGRAAPPSGRPPRRRRYNRSNTLLNESGLCLARHSRE